MQLFKKRKNKGRKYLKLYDPKRIYLLTTEITSDYNDGSGAGPRCVTQKYLAIKRNGRYYEFFSKVQIKYEDNSLPGFRFGEFNVPMIKKVEELREYVENDSIWLTAGQLFYFITKENAAMRVLESSEETDQDE